MGILSTTDLDGFTKNRTSVYAKEQQTSQDLQDLQLAIQ
jgi:hypothetical protein